MPLKNAKYSKKFGKAFKKSTPKNKSKVSKKVVQKIVKTEMAKNIENKITDSVDINQPIITTNASSVLQYFTWAPSGTAGIFSMTQGVTNNERIGNKIKLKRWVIKGAIVPNSAVAGIPSGTFTESIGYVNLYLIRRNDMTPVTSTLPNFYQDGSASQTPDGTLMQAFMPVNKDMYKVYWHKSYKMGNSTGTSTPPTGGYANNDFSLVRRFGVDVCKHICKNKVIKYDDTNTDPTDALIDSLALVAVFQNSNLDITVLPSAQSFFKVVASSYAEYEDA